MEWGTLWGHFCGVAKMEISGPKKNSNTSIYIYKKTKKNLCSWPPIGTYHKFGDLEILLFDIQSKFGTSVPWNPL
jgi:hypothetical protein